WRTDRSVRYRQPRTGPLRHRRPARAGGNRRHLRGLAGMKEKLRNIGPKSAAWLRQVGLRSRAELVEAGPVDAFMRVKRAGFRPTLNLLYSIEGALQDCHWQDVPEQRRAELVAAAEAAIDGLD